LAVATALPEPARQGAVLILRGIVQFSAAEVAELLETTPRSTAPCSGPAHLANVASSEQDVTEPEDAERRELLDRYCAAFETPTSQPSPVAAGRRQVRNAASACLVHRTRR
jgi:RNA polymerase sigma-70 factor (ECF subfamily)